MMHTKVRPQPFGPKPVRLICPICKAEVVTEVKNEPSAHTHLMFCILCVLLLWCFSPIPYCKASCQKRNHYCPACNSYIGSYRND